MPRSIKLLTNNMLGKDDPDHRRLRKLVDQAFARRGILDMRGQIEARADALLDNLAGQDSVELVDQYARRLPLDVISDLLGVAERDRARFADWSASIGSVDGVFGVLRMLASVRKLTGFIRDMIASARANPKPGIIAELLRANADGDKLDETELVAMVLLLMIAGMETTTNLIAGSVLALEANPAQKQWLFADPTNRMEQAVEELSRFVSAVQGTKPRYAAQDCVVAGQPVKRGEIVMALVGAANTDPAVFDAPGELRLNRFPNPHLAFSTGLHFCLGLQLARVETQSALARLYAWFPDLSVERFDYAHRIGHRAVQKLDVRLTASCAAGPVTPPHVV